MLLRVGNFFSGSFFFPAFSLTLLPPIIFSYLCFCLSSFPVSPDLPFFLAAPVAMVIVWFSTLFVPLFFPCVSFWIFLAPLIHLSHFSYFQHLYVFPDFGYQRIFSWKLQSPVFLSPPLRLLLPLYCLSFFQHPFRYFAARHFMKHCNFRGRLSFAAFSYRTFSHTVRLDGQTKSPTKKMRRTMSGKPDFLSIFLA